ncbi:hypothetical protein ACSBR2_007005 [Camellia fascicularis]
MMASGCMMRFDDFADSVPNDILLRKPGSHLSYGATEGDSHSCRGYGVVMTRDWYHELPLEVRDLVDKADFSLFCTGLLRHMASQALLRALVERWWDTTNSFHFSSTGEMTITPYDFSMITGLGVRGDLIPFDMDMALAPKPVDEISPTVPYSRRYDGRCRRRSCNDMTFTFYRRYFDTMVAREPWATMPAEIRDQYAGAWGTSQLRILLEGPFCWAWFLGERFVHQTVGLPAPVVPMPPPTSMRTADSLPAEAVIQFMMGLDADYFRAEGDYTTFI